MKLICPVSHPLKYLRWLYQVTLNNLGGLKSITKRLGCYRRNFFSDRKHFHDHNGILTSHLDIVVHKIRDASWDELVIMTNEWWTSLGLNWRDMISIVCGLNDYDFTINIKAIYLLFSERSCQFLPKHRDTFRNLKLWSLSDKLHTAFFILLYNESRAPLQNSHFMVKHFPMWHSLYHALWITYGNGYSQQLKPR